MPLLAGTRLGPYEVAELLGSGGMGAVYRARDPRLGRDVAIKVLPEDIASDPDRLRRFEQEAKAVAALNHPNILSVYDVGTQPADAGSAAGGASAAVPYLVAELLEGETLREVLSRRSPTQRQVLSWAVQTAQGLAAAHRKGIVHRDLKPENLFLTTDGRVKILDFGLAKQSTTSLDSAELTASSPTKPGVVMGTVAYMSPEQAQAQPVDERSDLFSFGVVLYELLAQKHPFRRETVAATLGAILQETPAPLVSLDPSIPRGVDGIVRRCLEKKKEDRFQGAHDLGLALEAVLQAPTGSAVLEEVEERSPYPGLSSFTERDASVFFGREAEVKALWERIRSRKLLAVIGPSGVGKTSFLRAGVVPARPEGWAVACATPGANPALGLARALTPELAGDAEAIGELLSGLEELKQTGELQRVVAGVKRWRSRHEEALLVLDQFEELFTLNPPETQARVAALLQRLVAQADVHVVLSMRDDFLIRCSDHEPLAPVFESLTPLTALTRDGLGRAVVEPARKRGYAFEDGSLVDEMVSTVEGVRGALPLLAFAVARLWEKRDREKKLLAREAYREIAGVEGALAQHAEATMDRIGPERQGLVREVFRNLVTAQGTRAVIDREELLSAFPDRPAAEEVLNQLIDARLLTTYEVEGEEGEPSHHRVEVVHESLLKAWPRLVRWQAQDEEGALLRDQLKQAARLWEEKGRPADLLWSGTSFQEYELWRERYAGALTALEEGFAKAMAERAARQRRRRRAIASAVLAASLAVAAVTGVLWARARAEARRAEASKLLALAQLKLQEDPTQALVLSAASLEVADTKEARMVAVRALHEAPPAWEVASGISGARIPAFSPDGRHLALAGLSSVVGVWDESGGPPLRLPDHESSTRGNNRAFWASNELLVTGLTEDVQRVYVWSVPGGTKLRTIDFGGPSWWQVGPGRLFARTGTPINLDLRTWRLPDGEAEALGRVDARKLGTTSSFFEPHGRAWLYAKGTTMHAVPLPVDLAADRLSSSHVANVELLGGPGLDPDLLVLHAKTGENRLLRFPESGPPVTTIIPKPASAPASVVPEASGRWVHGLPDEDARLRLWDTNGLPGARPLELRREGSWYLAATAFDPVRRAVVATTHNMSRLTFWRLPSRWPSVVDGYKVILRPLAFSPDGKWLATSWAGGRLRLWPLPGAGSNEVRDLGPPVLWTGFGFDPRGSYVFAVGNEDNAWIFPLDGAPGRKLDAYSNDTMLYGAAVSPTGRRVATAFGYGKGPKTLRVWDLDTGAVRLFDLPVPSPPPGSPAEAPTGGEGCIVSLAFVDDSTLYTAGHGGIRRWNIEAGTHELVRDCGPRDVSFMAMSEDGRAAVTTQRPIGDWMSACRPLEWLDLATGVASPLPQLGDCPDASASVTGSVAAVGSIDGIVRVGRASDREAHLLPGHVGAAVWVAVSPDLRWVASAGEDNTLRLWPMPDLSKPPLQALPKGELLARLRSVTNLRAVRDPQSVTGWTIELGPFPGWKSLPAW